MREVSRSPGALVLEDGQVYPGWLFGAEPGSVAGEPGRRPGEGEVVFNTCMTGYQEILTDPSYAGQLIAMTYPLIGNYGSNVADPESDRVWARALVVREVADDFSNWRSQTSLETSLNHAGVPGLTGVDTRALTRHLRSAGSLRAVLGALERPYDPRDPQSQAEAEALVDRSRRVTPLEEQDLVGETACTEPFEWFEELAPVYVRKMEPNLAGRTVVVVDYGVKRNILRSLRSRGARVLVTPPTSSLEAIIAAGPDGVVLSNGPGDPATLKPQVEVVRELFGKVPILGICLGHQLIGRAADAETGRLPFGHHGGNHPVQDLETGEVHITSQNHEFQVLGDTVRSRSGFVVRQSNLNDGSVEGLAHRELPIVSVQYHPEGAPGPHDNQYVFDNFAAMIRTGQPLAVSSERAPKAPSHTPLKVLVIGSGPIVIGQAAEFDYAGTQACKALREEAIETVLVNSNPATIMTEPGVADRTYIEPLTVEVIERIIAREQPDGLLPTLGGQTGLNLAVALHEAGVLARHNVRLLGTPLETIRTAEDREAFKQFLIGIGEPVTESRTVTTIEEARAFVAEVGLPLVVRPAFTLGGTGGGFIHEASEFDAAVRHGLDNSPISQVLLERSLVGWKEVEYEVMRDSVDTCITVCNMENLDPMGVHTGDSIVVAPSQTLSDKEYQMLRSSALKIIRGLGIEGGCNVQYALDPASFQYYVIEVNPRVSRSSALASKATGYPIARVAAKVAIGKRLDEIPNQVTGQTLAAFEPALDYCVVKIPRWPFDKFPDADRSIGTQMKATGEVMAIERTFEAAMMKAIRSLEQKVPEMGSEPVDEQLLTEPNDQRLFALLAALRQRLGRDGGGDDTVIQELRAMTSIDPWFLRRLARLVEVERGLMAGLAPAALRRAKTAGFTDRAIAALTGESIEDVRAAGFEAGVRVVYKVVDTCAAEFAAATPYYYSTYETEDESPRGQVAARARRPAAPGEPLTDSPTGPAVLVLGSGPIRIGQGIEFDYCSVQAAMALRDAGWASAMLNSNPETVSTDFDTSDRLYFDPLDEESAENVIRAESAMGVVVQFGGQTAINLAEPLARRGARILGSSVDAIDLAEDRRRFEATLREIGIPQPPGATATTVVEARAIADRVGYPVLVRPSYVLGGRAMEIVHKQQDLEHYLEGARDALARGTILIDKYLVGGEFEVDAICDGERVLIPGIMEHVERAGVHSGDSFAVYPAQHLSTKDVDHLVDYTRRIALRLNIIGLLNIQYVLHRNRIYVIEVNPRSSRTVPFLSKVTGVPMVPVAMAVMTGRSLSEQGYEDGLWPVSAAYAVKAPVFSMSKLLEVDSHLGPEMKSTGEVMGIDNELAPAMYKAFLGSLDRLPRQGVALCTIADGDKAEGLPIIARLVEMGFTIHATRGTARALRQAGISVNEVAKIADGSPHVVDLINSGAVDLVINTISQATEGRRRLDGSGLALRDGFEIRRAAVERRIPCLTSLDTAAALVESLNLLALDGAFQVMTVDEYRRGPASAPEVSREGEPEEAML
jgi:carbamoyl-phosphate synthase large subunit